MLPLAAYADRLSARPGETLDFKVSNRTGAHITAEVVRVICADPNPAGPGIRTVPHTARPEKLSDAGPHDVRLGSYAVVEMGAALSTLADVTFAVTVMPTRLGPHEQVIAAWTDAAQGGLALLVDASGALTVRSGNRSVELRLPGALAEHRWHTLAMSYEAGTRRLSCESREHGHDAVRRMSATVDALRPASRGPFGLAGHPDCSIGAPFNGRLERPILLARPVTADAVGPDHDDVVAAWDFAREMETNRIVDTGPHRRHGHLVNAPTRAMTGSGWTGLEMNWRHAPEQYGAIHFHEDDIEDCDWPTAFRLTIPQDMRSGTYALLLRAGDATENVPFFVVPPQGKRTADIALLVSTFTYTVYANHARPEWVNDDAWQAAWLEQSAAWNGYPANPGAHRDYGLSTYNYHTDGSGIALSSWHRPILNLRIGYLTYPYPDLRASGLRHYPADSHLTAWLEAKGYAFDVITDWELHTEGLDLLRDYPIVLTGTHPEYHTREMLDALTGYRDGGGRFCYLGGNGFYWKIALASHKPGLIEIRRGEGGIRAWAADPGEYYNQFDGEYGGLWRRNGRAPQKLSGVGFTAQGNFVGSHYRLTPEARDPRVAWMVRGIEAETIGGAGLSGHGAAGFELDRTDKRLGTPDHAIVVARSENHPPDAPWVLVPEEQLTHITTIPGVPPRQLIHADMTFFETAQGRGAVFSTGSITFCGSLPHNNCDNDVSRLLSNVIDRFLDPAPFHDPGGAG